MSFRVDCPWGSEKHCSACRGIPLIRPKSSRCSRTLNHKTSEARCSWWNSVDAVIVFWDYWRVGWLKAAFHWKICDIGTNNKLISLNWYKSSMPLAHLQNTNWHSWTWITHELLMNYSWATHVSIDFSANVSCNWATVRRSKRASCCGQ